MRYKKQTLATLASIVMLVGFTHSVQAADTTETISTFQTYEYEITPEDPEWELLESVEDKIAACRIPTDILKKMTDEQLIQAIFDYPFVYDVFVYSSIEMGVQSLAETCDAYAELITRNSARDALIQVASEQSETMRISLSAEDEIKNEILAALILYQENIKNNLSAEEIKIVDEISSITDVRYETNNDVSFLNNEGEIKTPNNTIVPYVVYDCQHADSDFHATIDQNHVETYGVTLLSGGSCKYNCHSYAWYSQSTSNTYWIPNPSPYLTDGSYTKVVAGISTTSLNAALGDKVLYGTEASPIHSAVIVNNTSGAPLATRIVDSKWGLSGLFRHTVTNVPPLYELDNVSAWH